MMALPFFIGAGAVYLALKDRKGAAVALTVFGILLLVVLYRLHATDTLDLSL